MNFHNALKIVGIAGLTFAISTSDLFAEYAAPINVDQGRDWNASTRDAFYSLDQGSRLIPLSWITALKQPNGAPFMEGSLGRYGYLPNAASKPAGLPVGFVAADQGEDKILGLTCSACHTRQIEVGGTSYRIDGGPALADIGALWSDIDIAVAKVLAEPAAFADFAQAVNGQSRSPEKDRELRKALQDWFTPFHAITEGGLPRPPRNNPWGPGRLDAVGMILNRVTGLDIGVTPDRIIASNIALANAPVRPPFIWNAWKQDLTQWPGFAPNGDDILGLLRNLGEVYGVFGLMHPKKDASKLLGIDYLAGNSANFDGLLQLEDLAKKIAPPKWPREWPLDSALADAGKKIFERPTDKGGCVECHGVKPGVSRLLNNDTWATPIKDVGTDSKEYAGLQRPAATGVLEGAQIPIVNPQPLQSTDSAVNVLGTVVKASVLQQFLPIDVNARERNRWDFTLKMFMPKIEEALKDGYKTPPAAIGAAYEARVLEGIWAAAPYLHNGSVPTLSELLKPATERVSEFKIGPNYDLNNVGLAADQSKFNYTMKTTDCAARDSGDSRCGHEYGTTTLTPEEKKALLEYLKIL
jgi:mono/diheme cytochrome c family protein